MKSKRESNFELLRIIAMIMIVFLHYMGHGGALNNTIKFSNNFFFSNLIESFSIYAVNIFILISGYFLIESKFKINKIFKIWLQVFFYSSFIYIGLVFIGFENFSIKSFLSSITPLLSNQYLFFSQYIILLILSPILNFLLKNISKKQHILIILILTIAFVLINLNLPITMVYKSPILGFVFLYIIASYIRLYGFKYKNNFIFLLGYIIVSVFIFFSRIFIYKLNLDSLADKFLSYNFLGVIFGSVCLFLFIKNINFKSDIINNIASLTFGIFLISDNNFIRPILYNRILKTSNWYNDSLFIMISIASVISIYIICSLIEYIRQLVFKKFKIDYFFELIIKNIFNLIIKRKDIL